MNFLYEVDPFNRLIVKNAGRTSRVKRFRRVIYGSFRTGRKNRLYYEIFKSSDIKTPQKIEFSGKYSLDKKHNLIFTLNKWNNQCRGNRLNLKTKIIDVDGSNIVFLVGSRLSKKKKKVYIMKLNGTWQADKNNRLTFKVRREKDSRDRLTFSNAWSINRSNEIEYRYGRGPRSIKFKGSWALKDSYRLGYVLDKTIDSGFDFKSSLGQIIPRGKEIYVKFDVAVELSNRRRLTRTVIFTCRCKLGRGRKIILELFPGNEKATLRLTRNFLDQKGIAYIESFIRDRERYVGAGIAYRW